MIYGYWNRRCDRQNFFAILVHFLPFHPLTTWKIKTFWKIEKKQQLEYHENKNHFTHVHLKWQPYDAWFLRYGSQRTECFIILDHYLPFYPPNNLKTQNFEKMKKYLEILAFSHVHLKWQPYDVWFLRYGSQRTEGFVILGHFLPFYSPL